MVFLEKFRVLSQLLYFFLSINGKKKTILQFLHIKLDRLISRSTCVESTQEENFTLEIFGLSFESYKRTITV